MSFPDTTWAESLDGNWLVVCLEHDRQLRHCRVCWPINPTFEWLETLQVIEDLGPPDQSGSEEECADCGGSGWYVGMHLRDLCANCGGSGWL